MTTPVKAKLRKILTAYLKEIHAIYTKRDSSEGSFYPALKDLFEECSHVFSAEEEAGVLVLPKRTEVGIPDFLIRKDGEIIGHIEAKKPDSNLHAVEVSEQLKRYRDALPNLILTNFLEFWLYKDGKLVYKAEISSLSALQDVKPPVPENLDSFFELLSEFYSFSTLEPKSASELAVVLAKKTRFSKSILEEVLEKEKEPDYPYPLIKGFYDIFKDTLIEELTEEGFVDLYAQTITYGLFAAKMMAKDTEINKDNAWGFIPRGVPLLAKIFYSFSGPNTPESLSWVIDDLVRVLNKTHISAIYEESFRQKRDPVIHFYETFLATYNPKQRERLGVYYTPLPVVSYIVRSIHGLLKSRFGKDKGFAEDDVMMLDPAAGTLTFVLRAIREALSELDTRGLRGLVPSYIERHILQQFFAFELLIVPYIIGHLRVSMALEREWGYKFKEHERFKFYLTNTLEMKEPKQETIFPELTEEGREAKKVKENVPILVVLGNPPYSGISENKGDWITGLIEDYKYVDGKHFGEKKHWLQDDYVKFIRFGQWKIDRTGEGILGFITNHSYLDNPTFRGMRQSLMKSFDAIYVLNLHGNSLKKEKSPDGSKDENVFDIQQGVAIGMFIKNLSLKKKALPKKKEQEVGGIAKVYYAEKWGLREAKYKWLLRNDIETTEWQELKPSSPYYFFVPRDETYQGEYEKYWKVTDIFPVNCTGIVTARDKFVIDFDREALRRRIEIFRDLSLSDDLIRQNFKLRENYMWRIKKARNDLSKVQDWKDNFTKILYRPFDNREIYFHDSVVWRTRKKVMRHMRRENVGLCVGRAGQVVGLEKPWNIVFCSPCIEDFNLFYRGGNVNFPLYIYPDESKGMLLVEKASKSERTQNFTPEFLQAIKEALGTEPTPEDIFYYIYAVLYSPTYRKRYEEFLKIDFPRVPLPSDRKQFKNLSELGKELVELHLLKHPSLSETEIGFPVSGSNTVEKVRYDEETRRVYFNKEQYFEGVSIAVWEYQIGGYQVMAKYLKDRKKRELSLEEIEHYMRVAKAIERTIEVQGAVEEVVNIDLKHNQLSRTPKT